MKHDQLLVCTSCQTQFLWTAVEQRENEIRPVYCPGCRVLLPAGERRRGVVKFYNGRKHWGFITQSDGGEVFFHRSGLAINDGEPVHEGDLVEYAVEGSPRGPQAMNILLLQRIGKT